MCGIAGILDFSKGEIDADRLWRMTRTMDRRGPDGEDIWREPGAGLGHRRLAIIDLAGGKQPMVSGDGRFVITYNGEVYNFKDLRKSLERRGVTFRTTSDTEVVLEWIGREGSEGVRHLWGQFALAVWDRRDRKLILARDRLGQKPLYTFQDGLRFYFASEMKAILEALPKTPDVDETGLYEAFYFHALPNDSALFQGMESLPSAHWMEVDASGTRRQRYWSLQSVAKPGKFEEAREEFLRLLEDAVERRLVSDVPLGAFLSGGVDSSTTVTAMAHRSRERVRTFCAVCKGDENPDLEYARRLAKRLGVEHTEVTYDPLGRDNWETLWDMVWRFETPYSLGSLALQYYYLCRETRKHVTVVLDGGSGDETFGGYPAYSLYRKLALARRVVPVKFCAPKATSRLLGLLTDPTDHVQARLYDQRVRRLSQIFDPGFFSRADVSRPVRRQSEIFSESGGGDILQGAILTDFLYNNYHTVSMLADRAGLGNSLEIRSPFIDHHISEFAATLPASWKVGLFGETKIFMKRALRGYLPDEILDRRKLGFGGHVHHLALKSWEPDLRRMFETQPLPPMLNRAGVLDALNRALAEQVSNWTLALWYALTLTIWWNQFVRKERMP